MHSRRHRETWQSGQSKGGRRRLLHRSRSEREKRAHVTVLLSPTYARPRIVRVIARCFHHVSCRTSQYSSVLSHSLALYLNLALVLLSDFNDRNLLYLFWLRSSTGSTVRQHERCLAVSSRYVHARHQVAHTAPSDHHFLKYFSASQMASIRTEHARYVWCDSDALLSKLTSIVLPQTYLSLVPKLPTTSGIKSFYARAFTTLCSVLATYPADLQLTRHASCR